MSHLATYPTISVRSTQEDAANLAAIADALRASSRRPFLPATAAIRAALRAAAILARQGNLDAVLARYRADLAGH
ncbi:hypothetical protein J5Y09_18190 [Roseomonas sp. PWR1]|uniref:Uncharacterized protein n=1 Tax=Roseomonas nitratireducens TaxID=2820810 RepID=A0ABS4AX47_9PROT|nr:hypothetical protein [Neoroseomonas nitratireducens]MBP0465862.1 hypothetical protein [Neoroseomonas nitratireducens]